MLVLYTYTSKLLLSSFVRVSRACFVSSTLGKPVCALEYEFYSFGRKTTVNAVSLVPNKAL